VFLFFCYAGGKDNRTGQSHSGAARVVPRVWGELAQAGASAGAVYHWDGVLPLVTSGKI